MIDVSGGDKIPRKERPGISQSDLLIINKVGVAPPGIVYDMKAQIDLAPHVGASLDVMRRDAALMRDTGPTLFTSIRNGEVYLMWWTRFSARARASERRRW